jgi:hypothetical protein
VTTGRILPQALMRADDLGLAAHFERIGGLFRFGRGLRSAIRHKAVMKPSLDIPQ